MSGGAARVVGGRYRLSGWLGRGGMGAVWAAHDTLLGRDVALKEIALPDDGAGPDDPMIRRALREARAAARLRHPGIVTVHDVVTEDGRPWIVMELIDGPSLAAAVREQGSLTEHRAAGIGLQVLDALHAAHRQGVLHRDVKPANILLDAGRVVLTDFGIAAIDDATSITSTGQMIGSPSFLAPERLNGRPATAAADMWALGVTLYIAVSGQPPFPGEDLAGTLAAILRHHPEPPAGAARLWPVIEGLLAKDPDRRLTTEQARPLLDAVVRAPGEQPGPAGRETVRQPSTRPALPPTLAAPTTLLTAGPGLPTAPAQPHEQAGPGLPTVPAQPHEQAGPGMPTVPAQPHRQAGPGVPTVPPHPYPVSGHNPAAAPAPRGAFPWHTTWTVLLVVSTLIAAGAILRETWRQLDKAAAQRAAASPGASPGGPASSSPSGTIPGTFLGEWSGTARQPIGKVSTWDVMIKFTATSPTGTFYTSLNCTGTLTVVAPPPTDQEIHLRQETGWNPRQACVDAADVTLTLDGDEMRMMWQDAGLSTNVASATLTKA